MTYLRYAIYGGIAALLGFAAIHPLALYMAFGPATAAEYILTGIQSLF